MRASRQNVSQYLLCLVEDRHKLAGRNDGHGIGLLED